MKMSNSGSVAFGLKEVVINQEVNIRRGPTELKVFRSKF